MSEPRFKLLIWDFDGVIADSEKIWLENRREILNRRFGLNWDFETINSHLGGMSDKTKEEVLDRLGIKTDSKFWDEAIKLDYQSMQQGLELTPGATDIFKRQDIKQCIATGGTFEKTAKKIEAIGIGKYFNRSQIFTADMVKHGKPDPELFLLATHKMGENPQDCVVIEDSLAGLTAGLRAGITTVAFIGCPMNQSQAYQAQIKQLGIEHIFRSMTEFQNWLFK